MIQEYSHVTMIALLLCCSVGTCEVLTGGKEGNEDESLLQQVQLLNALVTLFTRYIFRF